MDIQELRIRVDLYKTDKKRSNESMPQSLANDIYMAYVNSGETKAAFYGSLGYSKSNAGKMHSRIVKQTNVKLSDDDEIIHLIDYHKKYLNPEIARYLAIVDTLIEEEEYKLSIYEEMKALKEEQ